MKSVPYRFGIAILLGAGLAISYTHRIHINFALSSMVNKTTANSSQAKTSFCNITANKTIVGHAGEYNWSDTTQGLILSSFYWGYLIALLPSAFASQLTDVKWVFFGAFFLNITPSLFIPLCSDIHYSVVIVMRVVQGFGNGALIPALSLLLARWAPKMERNSTAGVVYSGSTLGVIVGTVLIGLIERYLGWRPVFYILGGISFPWLLVWGIVGADSPENAKYISQHEVDYILSSFGETGKSKTKVTILWKNIFTSKPFWALFVTHGCANWAGYLLITDIPLYLAKAFNLPTSESANYFAIAGALNGIFGISLGYLLDYLRRKKNLSQTWAKKTAVIISNGPEVALFIGIAFIGCDELLGIVISIIMIMLLGGASCGWFSNHVDIGPKIAATLMGLTNTAGTLSGIIVPIFVGLVLGDGASMTSWTIIFLVGAAFMFIVLCVFTIFGSGAEQNYYIETDGRTAPPSSPT